MENSEAKKIIFSGIQPSGDLTIGNYLGALKNWVKLQDEYNSYFCVVDLHAITVPQKPADLRRRTLELLSIYLACGIDPQKNTLFIQSHVPAHAEAAWILTCNSYIGELSRMTQYKDKSKKAGDSVGAGLFTYPVLMAADILLYKANLVPVGEDQKQHLEITRDIAERFNKLYGDTFVIPEAYVRKETARIMGLQDPTSKMSKSATNLNDVIFLDDSEETIIKKIKKAVTDSENVVRFAPETKPGVSNLMQIYSAITNKGFEEIEKDFEGKGYGDFKMAVAEVVVGKLKPIQEKYNELLENRDYLVKVYTEGKMKAEKIAIKTINEVKEKIGIL